MCLPGLAFHLKPEGGYILDTREGQERFVGGIIPGPLGRGYTVCSFVKKTIVFDTVVPENLKSPQRAQFWVQQHAAA